MTRAENKARLARQAIAVLAQQAAKNAVKNYIRSQGWKLWDFTSADITLWAEVWLREHPEMFAQARVRAVEFGYETEIAIARDTQRSDQALSSPNPNARVALSGQADEAGTARASLPRNAPG